MDRINLFFRRENAINHFPPIHNDHRLNAFTVATMKKSDTVELLPNLATLAARVKWARKKAKLTQEQLAAAIGETQPYIADIERGKNKNPTTILAIANAVSVSPAWLQFGKSEIDQLSSDGINLALAWEKLPEPQRSALKNAIIDMAKSSEDTE